MSYVNMDSHFAGLVRSCIPKESLFLHIGRDLGGMLELKDRSLMSVSTSGRATSPDGGKTWTEPEPVRDVEGRQIEGGFHPRLVRLKSGAIGGFYGGESDSQKQYGMCPWFGRSDDEGKTWSKPVRVGEPYNNAVMHNGTIVTSKGRIVAPVYKLIGKTVREKGRALFGDHLALVGHHGYEHFFTYCWVYYSDDEGETWQTNEGKGVWGAGGELFVTLDYSAGGHYRCNEPSVAEVSPDPWVEWSEATYRNHLLMLLRTPLGRLYQSWSKDDGTTWSRPEPTTLASALAPPALERIPGTNDLLVIWNQSSADEIERGMQRHRLSSAISTDGGVTWNHRKNIFSLKEGDITYVEPSPIKPYRAMEHSPKLPPNDIEGTYPYVTFWKDVAIIRLFCRERAYYIIEADDRSLATSATGYDLPAGEAQGVSASVYIGLPISWFSN